MFQHKRKALRKNVHSALLERAVLITRIINLATPFEECDNGCTDHLVWGCEGVHDEYRLIFDGAVYPDGGWTAFIKQPSNPDYFEKMAFIPSSGLLLWKMGDVSSSTDLDLGELQSLMVGEIPNN